MRLRSLARFLGGVPTRSVRFEPSDAGQSQVVTHTTGAAPARFTRHIATDLGQMLLLAVVYYAAASLSLRVALVGGQVTPIWPPTGIALVGLLLFGRKLWPGIALSAFLINAPIGSSLLAAGGIAVGNTVAPLLAATLLERAGFRPELERVRDAVAIVLIGAFSMIVSAGAGTSVLLFSGSVTLSRFWSSWSVWWAGDAMGVLLVAPFLLSLRTVRSAGSWHRRAEAVLLFGSLAVVSYSVFLSRLQIKYLVFPFLAWAAWRFRQRGAAPAALLASAIAIWAAITDTGSFASGTLLEKMLTLQVFNLTVALLSLVLAAVASERAKDIGERERTKAELARRALHDPLTGLPNRALFMDTLNHALARSKRDSRLLAVYFLDLDRFKMINDSLGHEVGDEVLACTAQRLSAAVRPTDTASRFGGDEFVILCEDIEGEQHAATIADRLLSELSEPIPLDTGEVVLTVSAGIAIAIGTTAPEDIIQDADAAMYRAKERGRARYELYDKDVRARVTKRQQTERELRLSIEAGELRVHYQPLVDVRNQRVASLEALVRWEHPQRGLLAPDEFIPEAEESGLIGPLGAWVLEQACRQTALWRSADPNAPTVAVNLSARQLTRPGFEPTIERVLSETGLDASALTLEITETALMDASPTTLDLLDRLRQMGVHLAIDDFGKGYSSLSYLKSFPVDALKVDRSFVSGLGRCAEDSAIVAAVVTLAHALGLSAIAEGVETERQLEQLRRLDCDLAQGYYVARPQPAEDFEADPRRQHALGTSAVNSVSSR